MRAGVTPTSRALGANDAYVAAASAARVPLGKSAFHGDEEKRQNE